MVTDLHDFMATMVASSPPVPLESAVALARDRYGLEVQATRMTGERDENFRLSAADSEYVLKIAHPAEDPEVTELLTAVLLHLEASAPRLPCPRVVRTAAGETRVRVLDPAGRERTARILTYLPGQLLASTTGSAQQRRSCGLIAGRLTQALYAFRHPAARRVVIWDVRHAAQVRRLLDELPDFPHARAAAELLEHLIPRIEAGLPALRHQIVHNDINPLNVLVDPSDQTRVIGIIDFGDLTYTALIADVAVTAAEQIPTDCGDDAMCARAAVLDIARAYHESAPLRAAELAMLGTLTAARLAANLVVHEWHLRHNPSSGHHKPLEPEFIRARLAVARHLSRQEFEL
jgi:Ser/Thr protein kinase RdoA (MazF antagonist)